MPIPPRLRRWSLYAFGAFYICVAAPLWVLIWYERSPLLGAVQAVIIGGILYKTLWLEGRAELRRERGRNLTHGVSDDPPIP